MGSMKNYLLTLLQQCSEERTGQEAIEHALVCGTLKLTYNLQTDLHTIFDQRSTCCDAPMVAVRKDREGICRQCRNQAMFETNYDRFIVAYQRKCQEHGEALTEVYRASGLLEEILRPVPLAVEHHQSVEK
jgi:hypothetical protein